MSSELLVCLCHHLIRACLLGRARVRLEQIFDLYGYPLPGRQLSLSIRKVR